MCGLGVCGVSSVPTDSFAYYLDAELLFLVFVRCVIASEMVLLPAKKAYVVVIRERLYCPILIDIKRFAALLSHRVWLMACID